LFTGCVDIWNGKVLRSAAGSHYRIPILSNITWSQVPAILPPADNIKVYLADSNQITTEQNLDETMATRNSMAMQEIEQTKDYELSDVESDVESDDVDDEDDYDDYNVDEDGEISARKNSEKLTEDIEEEPSYRSFKVLSAYKNAPINNIVYDKVDYSNKHTVLVISGETSGLSLPAKKLAYDHFGECVHLPMTGGVESLNCAIAGSIVMYEVAKQHRKVSGSTSEDE
jgi:tRNA G18 (ribose-2'-O)-methylase SpoU